MPIALAAPHPEAIAAGQRAIAAGGNALDAALAASVMLTVVYPHQCALGGDLIAVLRSPDGQTTAIVAAGTAPAAVMDAATSWTEVPKQGAHAVTVPGMVAGWLAIAAAGASHALSSAITDAALVAEQGAPISAGLARALHARGDIVRADAGLRDVFARGGEMLREGDTFLQPALARTLRRLAIDPLDIYRGETAAALVACLRAEGGTHTVSDFAQYQPEVVPAISRQVGAHRWYVAPPPSVGAVLVGVGLRAEGGTDADLVEAAVAGVHARGAYLGDPVTPAVNLDALLALGTSQAVPVAEPRPQGDTVAVTALDDEGWGVTIVQSVYQTFGAGLMDPVTGVVFHNRGGAFSVDPTSPAMIAPGIRPPHTLCPAIVDGENITLVAGCQGGRAQAWILSQLLTDAADPQQSLESILSRPRWVVGDRDLGHDQLTLVAEPGVAATVINHAHAIDLPVAFFDGPADEAGHVQFVRRTPSGLDAASDPRADGIGIVS